MKAGRKRRDLFPIPLVGVATILVVLIFLTPALITSGAPAAGTIVTRAELIVDHPSGSNTTNFYVHAVGTVRYAIVRIGIAENYQWNNPPPLSSLVWGNWTNGTQSVGISVMSALDPVAVNVSAYYTTPHSGSAWYFGILAFQVAGNTLSIRSYTSGVDVPSSVSISGSQLPLPILLEDIGSRAP